MAWAVGVGFRVLLLTACLRAAADLQLGLGHLLDGLPHLQYQGPQRHHHFDEGLQDHC